MVMQIPYLIPLFFVMFLAYIACQVVNSLLQVIKGELANMANKIISYSKNGENTCQKI
jgi:hypothetical protein